MDSPHPFGPDTLASSDRRKALLVVGMHRSGTSAFTRVLSLLGAKLPANLMPPAADNNPDGFWESLEVARLDDEILAAAHSTWDDWRAIDGNWLRSAAVELLGGEARSVLQSEFGDTPLIVLKDPRLCRTLPFWVDVLRDAGIQPYCVLPLRNPMEVAASLGKRDGFPDGKSYLLWLRYVLEAEADSRGLPRSFLSYGDLLSDWRRTLRTLQGRIGLALPAPPAESSGEIDAFLKAGSRHSTFSTADLEAAGDVPAWVRTAYAALLGLAERGEAPDVLATLDQVRREFDRASGAWSQALEHELSVERQALAAAHEHRRELETLVAGQNAHVAALTATRRELEVAVVQQQQQVEKLETLIAERAAHVAARSDARRELEAAIAQHSAQRKQFEAANRRLEARICAQSKQFEAANRRLEARIEALAEQRTGLRQSLQLQRTRIARIEEQRDQALFRLNGLQSASVWPAARLLLRVEQAAPAPVKALTGAARVGAWTLSRRLRNQLAMREEARAVLAAGLFDEAWYVRTYPDVVVAGLRPLTEWLIRGWHEERSPHPLFDTSWYLRQNPDAGEQGLNPVIHYLKASPSEGRDPHPLFWTFWYIEQANDASAAEHPLRHYLSGGAPGVSPHPLFDPEHYSRQRPEAEASGMPPLVHYLTLGSSEADPHPLFDTAWYLQQHPAVAASGINPLVHYLAEGAAGGSDPHPTFFTQWYLDQNPDVADAGINPLIHFVIRGALEGRDPNPMFDSSYYLREYPEVAGRRINPLIHYLQHGLAEGFLPGPQFDEAHLGEEVVAGPEGPTPLERYLRRLRGKPSPVGQESQGPSPQGVHSSNAAAHAYRLYLEAAAREPAGEYYVPDTFRGSPADEPLVRAIAFYLPQFHPIRENDEWWGKGFTEWTNVSKAVPQFIGHYQPHLPGEFGFYDLRVPEVQQRQAALARQYGLSGFCYHYYWFAGRRLLERPLQQMLADPSIEFPFCICWANENWTRRWDGQESDILLAQDHSASTDLAFIDDVIPMFRDPRYIRVKGRPVLIVYRVDLLPQASATAARWRERCRELGETEPYLVAAQTFGTTDPRPFGFDAAVEFPPHNLPATEITGEVTLINQSFGGHVYSYRSLLEQFSASDPVPYVRFRCVMPSWDNEARKPGQGSVYAGASPRLYGEWLYRVCREAAARDEPGERLVFINAWNEWAEGTHLEPDRRYGYGYLHVTGETIRRTAISGRPGAGGPHWLSDPPGERSAGVAVIAHVYEPASWPVLVDHLNRIPQRYDLFVTLTRAEDAPLVDQAQLAHCEGRFVALVDNRGRDVGPFLGMLSEVVRRGYDAACKVHAKGTSTRADGDRWGADLLSKVLGQRQAVNGFLRAFEQNPALSLIVPTGHLLPIEAFWGRAGEAERNLEHLEDIARCAGLPKRTHGFSFPAGSAYWFRPAALAALAALDLTQEDFPPEAGQSDGTLAHAIERAIGLFAATDGWRPAVTRDINPAEPGTEWLESGVYPFACATRGGTPIGDPVVGLR